MSRLTVVGSYNQDLFFDTSEAPRAGETVMGSFRSSAGGKGFNQAVAAARAGAETTFIAALGDDDAGRTARQLAQREGIDGCWHTVDDQPTGRAGIVVDARGENRIVVAPGANERLDPAFVTSAIKARPPAVLLVQLEVPSPVVVAALKTARDVGSVAILNPAPAPRDDPAPLLRYATVVTPNTTELDRLAGTDGADVAAVRVRLGVDWLVVTRGDRGVAWAGARDGEGEIDAYRVSARDTTGAGDAFNGVLAACVAEGGLDSLPMYLHRAQAAAALSVQAAGAAQAMPFRPQIDEFMRLNAT